MEHMYSPWRNAFVEGRVKLDIPSPSSCIFCDYPWRNKEFTCQKCLKEKDLQLLNESSRLNWSVQRLILHEGEHAFVILNRYPYGAGHLMVVPYKHTSKIDDLEDSEFQSLHCLLKTSVRLLREAYRPDGMNIGMNMGKAGGAGIDAHIHYHVLPRWDGDVNFMPNIFQTKVISESVEQCFTKMRQVFVQEFGEQLS